MADRAPKAPRRRRAALSSQILATTGSSSQRELLACFQKKEDHEDETYQQHHQPTPLHCVESSNGELPEGIVVHSGRPTDTDTLDPQGER